MEFYTKVNGEKPAKDFILSLDVKMRAKVLGIINVLEEKGNQLREPYSKHLDDGIFEIRGKVGTDITRVLYFFYYGKKIIITNGFIKKAQETPRKEIKLAKSYRKDYLERVKKMSEFQEFLNEQLQDDEFRKEWEDIQPAMDVIRAMDDAKISQSLT